jgi:hypothetical protein
LGGSGANGEQVIRILLNKRQKEKGGTELLRFGQQDVVLNWGLLCLSQLAGTGINAAG